MALFYKVVAIDGAGPVPVPSVGDPLEPARNEGFISVLMLPWEAYMGAACLC